MSDTEPSAGSGYERTDVGYRGAAWILAGVAFILVVGAILAWAMFAAIDRWTARSERPVPALVLEGSQRQPPEPRLLMSPQQELARFQKTESETLGEYAWVDEKGGIVRIPIERAMDVIAERGLPTREKSE